MIPILIFIIAVGTSIIAGLIGIGGGLILVPSLTTLGGLAHTHAAGTALASMFIFSLISSIKNNKNNLIVWGIAMLVASGSVIGAFAGSFFSVNIPLTIWKTCFILIALYLIYNMLILKKTDKSPFVSLYKTINKLPFSYNSKSLNAKISISGFFLFGTAIGIISSILGLGGGFLTTPFFILGVKLPPRQAVASSIAVISMTSLSGAISHYTLGHFSLIFWIAATMGMAIGGYVGAVTLKKIPEKYIKHIFAYTVLFSIILILLK